MLTIIWYENINSQSESYDNGGDTREVKISINGKITEQVNPFKYLWCNPQHKKRTYLDDNIENYNIME
jgi:hypothetical protein